MQSELPFDVIERNLQLPVDSARLLALVGVRRCGKSSIMKYTANQLIASGVDPQRVLWINFDDERLVGMRPEDFDEILQAYRELYPDIRLSDVYMFFDEIQLIDNWELFVLRVYKSYCKNIFISGSNAKMLSSQIATALRGWPIEYEVFPLAFDEYLNFKGVSANANTEPGRATLIAECRHYLNESAYPEAVLTPEESLRIRTVQSYFNTMMFRDLIEHYRLSDPEVVRYFLKRVMHNLTKPTSVNGIYNDIKSQGRKIDKNRLYQLLEMACEIFLFYRVSSWTPSLIKEQSRQAKYYLVDNGLYKALLMPQSDDNGKMLENAVFMHLRRNLQPMQKITYFGGDYECDFVVQHDEHIQLLVQVCWSLADDHTRSRELRGLKAAATTTGCTNMVIVTFDETESIPTDLGNVNVVPMWKWLLSSPF